MIRHPSFKSVILIIFQLAAFAGYAWLRLDNASHVKEPRTFGDTSEYIRVAGLPVASRQFWTDLRPPVTPLLWKFVGVQPEKIFQLQLYFSIFCWAVLAFAFACTLHSYTLKAFAYTIVLAFSLSRDIFMWDPFLGSESVAFSFTALFLSAVLWLLMKWDWWKFGLLILAGLFLVLTRDTYAYLLLMAALIIAPLFWSTRYRWGVLGLSGAFLVLYLLSTSLATAGMRPFRSILMITSLRIYPSEEYTEYFRQHGMPVDDRLVAISRDPINDDKFYINKALLFNEDQQVYREWVLGSGRGEYLKYLWFYKADTLQKVLLETPQDSFYPDVYYYTATGYRPIIKDPRLTELLYPTRFGLVFFFAANLIAAFAAAFAWIEKRHLWLLPLLMILLSYPQAVLVWAADANDIARHSVAHNVLLRLGVWMLAFLIADSMIADFLPGLPFFKRARPSV
jgi:hypothetical protein